MNLVSLLSCLPTSGCPCWLCVADLRPRVGARADASEALQERHDARMKNWAKLKAINAGGPDARRKALRSVGTYQISYLFDRMLTAYFSLSAAVALPDVSADAAGYAYSQAHS